MLEKKYVFGLLFLVVTTFGFGQTTENLLQDPSKRSSVKIEFKKIQTDEKATTILKSAVSDVDSGQSKKSEEVNQQNKANKAPVSNALAKTTTSASSETAGSTAGEFSVSLTGAATYSIPFSLPPGIKDLVPNVGLSFSSQAGNGLAGWGWNVSGLSTISRIPSTKKHDGVMDPVDFDILDRFSLDGQRLVLKSGTYGAANSEYQTENYSNTKIRAIGTSPYGASYGPSYFVLHYPDGSRAWYGYAGNSRGRLEWALYKKQDPQGNAIVYNYVRSGNLLRIDKIKYGARNRQTPPNYIQFNYKSRNRPERSYVNGILFTRNHILDKISVYGKNTLYRKYQLLHSTSSLSYQKLSRVTESNAHGTSFSPIQFSYQNTSSQTIRKVTQNHRMYPGVNYKTSVLFGGDFDGDGKTDVITYDKSQKNKLNVFTDLYEYSNVNLAYEVTTSNRFETAFASRILSWNGKVLGQQGITTVTNLVEKNPDYVEKNLDYYDPRGDSEDEEIHTTRFRTFAMAAHGPVFQYDKVWRSPTYTDQVCDFGYGSHWYEEEEENTVRREKKKNSDALCFRRF